MTVNNTAWRDVYRPTMYRKAKVEGNKGTEVVMYKKDAPAPTPPLSVGSVAATGDPYVGYTLSCSEPTVTGGSGNVQIAYAWPNGGTSNTYKLSDSDLGLSVTCSVTVTDKTTGETTTVDSNAVGPVNRPIIPEYECFVDSNLYDDPSAQVDVAVDGSVVLEVRPETVSNPALDLGYRWQVRSGTGRLSGDVNSTGIIYIAPDTAPAAALVTCTVSSNNAADNAQAAEVTIVVT